MRRNLFAAAVLLSTAAALAGPAHGGEEGSRTLRIGLDGWENNVTPFTVSFASQPNTADFVNLIYDTLFWSQASPDPEPWLAESAEPSSDRKSWTVKLRPGVKWHDGRPLSAEDVKFTFEYFKAHTDQSLRYGHHVSELPVFSSAEVLSETELRLLFEGPAPSFKIVPGADLPILPKHIWQTIDAPLRAATMTPVGTGPFRMLEMTSPRQYRLRANEEYFKGKPLVDELDISVQPEPNQAFKDFLEGKVDVLTRRLPPVFIEQLAGNPQVKPVKGSRMESVQLNFNARKAPLSDPKLRKAISLSIDNRVLVQTVLGGNGAPGVDSFVHPASEWSMPDPRHEFDAGAANRLLDSSGYSRKDSDGIRKDPEGKRLEFVALFSTLEPESLHALQLIAQMTTAIGVRLEPEPATPSELRSARRAAPGQVPGYDAYVSELDAHNHSDPDALFFLFHSPGKGMGSQTTGYTNRAFDSLVEEAAVTASSAERKRKLAQAQAILAEEVPAIALFYPEGVYAFRPAAYDGWIPDPGHGLFTKRSFLEDYARPGSASSSGGLPPAWVFLAGVAGLVVLGSALVVLGRRPVHDFGEPSEDEEGTVSESAPDGAMTEQPPPTVPSEAEGPDDESGLDESEAGAGSGAGENPDMQAAGAAEQDDGTAAPEDETRPAPDGIAAGVSEPPASSVEPPKWPEHWTIGSPPPRPPRTTFPPEPPRLPGIPDSIEAPAGASQVELTPEPDDAGSGPEQADAVEAGVQMGPEAGSEIAAVDEKEQEA